MRPSLLDARCLRELETWVQSSTRQSVLLIKAASTGCGVSMALRDAIDRCGCECVSVHDRTQRIRDFAADAAVMTHTALARKRKIFVIDPVDAVCTDPIAAMDILDLLRTNVTNRLPIICAGFLQRSTYARIVDALGKQPYDLIEFPAIERDVALRHLRALYPRHATETIEATWDACGGDIRSCMVALDFRGDQTNVKDAVCDGLDAMRKLLFDSVSLSESMKLHDGDSQLLNMGVFENYCHAKPDIFKCTTIADAFAAADVVDERVYGRQEFELAPLYAALSAGVPALTLTKPAAHTFDIEKVGTIWSRGNNQRSKEKTVREIVHATLESGMQKLTVTELAMLRTTLAHLAKQNRYADMAQLTTGLHDSTVLNIMRLFKTKYTQADHAKFKKQRVHS